MRRRFPRTIALAATLAALGAGAVNALGNDAGLGARLYAEGRNARDEPVRALVGQPPSPLVGERSACAACHGADARGGPVPGTSASDVRWSDLARSEGHARPNGRAHGPYDARSFAQAVNEGVDPSGGRLGVAMPRYSLSATEIAALIAFLKTF